MPPESPIQRYCLRDLETLFSRSALRQSANYAGKVAAIDIGAHSIRALVAGSAPQPYSVSIDFVPNPPIFASTGLPWLIEPNCSCAEGYACRHAAAVMQAALKGGDRLSVVNPEVVLWAENLRETGRKRARIPARPSLKTSEAIYYLLEPGLPQAGLALRLFKGAVKVDADRNFRPLAGGALWNGIERALTTAPAYVDEADLTIFRLLRRLLGQNRSWSEVPLSGALGADVLQRLLATGRACLGDAQALDAAWQPLKQGAPRPAELLWRNGGDGRLQAWLQVSPEAAHVAAVEPPWFIDPQCGEAGAVSSAADPVLLCQLLKMPPLASVDIAVVADAMAEALPELPLPPGDGGGSLRMIESAPVPVLRLDTLRLWSLMAHRAYPAAYGRLAYDFAQLFFRYDDITLAAHEEGELQTLPDGETVRIKRQRSLERNYQVQLRVAGFQPPPRHALQTTSGDMPAGVLGLESEAAWAGFFKGQGAVLRAAGWEIEHPDDFRYFLSEAGEWDVSFNEINEAGQDWFDVSLGIEVDGQRVDLAPLLYSLFQRDTRWLDATHLREIADTEQIILTDGVRRRLAVPAGRLKRLANTLIDLFDALPQGALRVSRLDATRLAELVANDVWRTEGLAAVQRFATALPDTRALAEVAPPAGLALDLRPYQREGLGWLQHLRQHGLAGILADDMGLGKTAQTLAHLLLEKEAGRLDRPALIVLPTSLIFNWQREAERFAPGLRVLSLHGKERQTSFNQIAQHDVCLTTYPLLWRDEEVLAAQPWHLLILDEAQTVKNAASRAAVVVRKLDARHRLCLTGTPLENHLGELWAQFDFLLPGFLGDNRRFNAAWRNPIEKHGNLQRRELLARRIRPFILRRRKDDVAKELPPKTVIVRAVEFESGQRDLYETVRSAMDKQVRDAIAAQGFARSQIVILDALLKLRQVCCDPRLLKLPAATRVSERAKLDLLMDVLPEMIEEGRRVLLFSQFTGMLDLIQAELLSAGLDFVRLDGQTQDRQTPIRRFQEGEVPIFLISLKAGGVGLNLTAADTVIHYDPWWNPAAENQATDRAHRIGQDKPVFVYKLIVAGSIEEKILALQERKAELAASVLSGDSVIGGKFGETDIAALLAPLPAGAA